MEDASTILWGLLFGSVGIGYFIYGRRQGNRVALLAGLGLMIYPYFVSGTAAMLLVGGLLMSLPRFFEL